MNAIFVKINTKEEFDLFYALSKSPFINEIYPMVSNEFISKKKDYNQSNIFFNYDRCFKGDYTKEPYFKQCIPIDEKIIMTMQPYENDIMHMMDREGIVDSQTRWRKYYAHLQYWNYIIERLDINIFISNTIPNGACDYIAYCFCKIKGIPFVGSSQSHIRGYSYMLDDVFNHNVINHNVVDFEGNLPSYMLEIYNFYIDENTDKTPYYMANNENNLINTNYAKKNIVLKFLVYKHRIRNVLGLIKKILSPFEILKYIQYTECMNYNFFREPETLIYFYKKISEYIDCNSAGKYIYFALHMQPESTTSPIGGVFVDQLLAIKMISFQLPKDWTLIVKEHPCQFGNSKLFPNVRTLDLYYELLKLKNVKIASQENDTYTLINYSQAVATITGTVAWEAMFKFKPCLFFGHHIQESAPSSFVVRTNDDCKNAIEKLIEGKINISKEDIKKYLFILDRYLCLDNRTFAGEDVANSNHMLIDKKLYIIEEYLNKIKKICE